MKQAISLLVISALFIAGCQTKSNRKMFQPEFLSTQRVSFDVTHDTIIKTRHGMIVRIPAGSLQTTGNPVVTIEIKEAGSISEMIKSGLATQSDGKLLSSAGLLLINPVGEDQVRINKPISVAIPTALIDDSMKLYKGELNEDSSMNWTDPKPMLENPQVKAMQFGKSIFVNNCASCHGIEKAKSGPELAHIIKRSKPIHFGEEGYVENGHNLLYDFTRNNQAVLKWSLYYRCLYNQYNKTPMNVFPDLTETDLNNLYSYIENESDVRKLPVPDNGIEKCLDSCLLYAEAKIRLKQMKSGYEGDSVKEAEGNFIFNASVKDTSMNKKIVVTRSPVNYIADLEIVDPIRKKPLYYQFKVESFGWYNIQKILEGDNSAKESLLLVKVSGVYDEKLSVYFVIPSLKVVAEGNILDVDKNTYGFYSKDGTIMLPQNLDAFVVALRESKDSIAFAKKEFVTSNAQYFDLTLSQARKSAFNQQMNPPNTNTQMGVQVKDTRSASAIRRMLKDITDAEELKPKNCNCSCFTLQPVDMDSKPTGKDVPASKVLPASKDSTSVVVSIGKDSVSSKSNLKAEVKKPITSSSSKAVKKTTNNSKKTTTSSKKKKPAFKPRIAKR